MAGLTPRLTKNWTITPNIRLTPFVSLLATMGWFAYENKTKLLANGWTLIGTSNGVTAAFDGTGGDRFTLAPKSGVGDSFAFSSPDVTLTDAAGLFTPGDVGRTIIVAGATSGGNNGSFTVASYISATQITYANASGVAEAFTGTWLMSAFATRATVTNAPQSWFIVENALGCQLLFSYMGATDDVCVARYSQGGLFILPVTPTHMPQATDQAVISGWGNSIINATASGDRVMSIWVEPNSWGNALFRAGTIQNYMGIESFDSAVNTTLQATPMLAFKFAAGGLVNSVSNRLTTFPNEHPGESPQWNGVYTYANYAGVFKYTRGMAVVNGYATAAFGYIVNPSTNPWATATNTPRLQNNAAIGLIPLILNGASSGQSFGNNDIDNYGFIGIAKDWYWGINHATALNDVFAGYEPTDLITDPPRSNWFISFGPGCIRPWKNASGLGMELA